MATSKVEPIQFLATFPSVMAAIKITGDGNGMRIQLDIPEVEMGAAARLLLMREKVLKVTVELEDTPQANGNKKRY